MDKVSNLITLNFTTYLKFLSQTQTLSLSVLELAGLRLRNGFVGTSPGKTAKEITARGCQTVRFCTVLKECIEPEKQRVQYQRIVLRPRYKINRCGGTGQKQT